MASPFYSELRITCVNEREESNRKPKIMQEEKQEKDCPQAHGAA
jgi:hypothetical protein